MMELSVKQLLGQKLEYGFHGTALTEEFKDLIREYKIGNVILFRRNIESADQMRRLCGEIREFILRETGIPPFIIIDEEGGMVSRLPKDAVNVPGAMAVAATGDPENARLASQITIRQLRGLGANFNMAPVLDVNSNPANPVIGVRSYGDRAERVAAFGCASIAPYAHSGAHCCIKHFPGHGDTAVDSHLGLPRVDKTEQELEQLELIPFRRAIPAGAPAVMMSHVIFPNIEASGMPCTMSRYMVTELLRKKLGFRGLIFTDCMEMLAIRDHFGTPEGVVASVKAGVDIAEISATFELEVQAAQALNQAAQRGELDMAEIRQSVERILEYKRQLFDAPEAALCNRREDREAVLRMSRQAVTQLGGTPFQADEDTFFCGCADYRVSGVANEDGGAVTFPEYMARTFGAKCLVTPKEPTREDIRQAAQQAERCGKIVLGTCNGHLFRGQLDLARALAALGKPLAVIALRNPYDLSGLPAEIWKLAAYDYEEPALCALADVLRGGKAEGICPVEL